MSREKGKKNKKIYRSEEEKLGKGYVHGCFNAILGKIRLG